MEQERTAAPSSLWDGRVVMIDAIKALSIVMVILTHVADVSTKVKRTILYPFTILPAVPLFLMMSVFAFSLAEDRMGVHGVETIPRWFENKRFYRRLNRFLFPYLATLVVEIIALFAVFHLKRMSMDTFLRLLLLGGRGPGNYFILIVFQLMALFPFMRYAFDKAPFVTVLSLAGIQIVYEQLCRYWMISDMVYACLIFRYLTHLALGFVLYRYYRQMQGTAIPAAAMVLGGIYLIWTFYLGYEQVLVNGHATRSMIAVLFSFGMLYYLLRLEPWAKKIERGGCFVAYATLEKRASTLC